MGPCLFRHGNIDNKTTLPHTYYSASMGPCLFRHGNFGGGGCKKDQKASMGPCLFRHGNKYADIQISGTTVGFNGAVPFQARKYSFSMYASAQLLCFNGAVAFSGTE